MSVTIPESSSLDSLLEYVGSRKALFLGSKELGDLAGPFGDLLVKLRAKRDERDDVRIARRTASARVKVEDAEWDFTVGQIGALARMKPSPQEDSPLARLFPAVSPSGARQLGPSKATILGAGLVQDIRTLNLVHLLPYADRLEAHNRALELASAARTKAIVDEAGLDAVRVGLVLETGALADVVEAQLLGRLPGRHDLVSAYLSPRDDAPKARAVKDDTEDDRPE